MRRRRFAKLALALSALLGGCGSPAQTAAPEPTAAAMAQQAAQKPAPAVAATELPPSWRDLLYIRQGGGSSFDRVAVLNGSDGAGVRDLPFGLPAPDWSALYTVEASSGKTTVRAVDTATGKALRETTIDGEYSLPAINLDGTLSGLSPNGAWLTLAQADQRAYTRDQRSTSRFVVFDSMFEQPPQALEIDGWFSFDAISNSGRTLYLIEHLVPDRPEEYRVRFYDLAAGALNERIIADKRAAPQLMAGTRHSSLALPDGSWLFSVYLNTHHGPFIHALNLNDAFALCIFLPADGKEDWQRQLYWSLTMNPRGQMYAVNGALGIVAEIDPSQMGIRRTTSLGAHTAGAPAEQQAHVMPGASKISAALGGAALSPDGRTLWASGTSGLLAISVADFELRGQYLTDRAFNSLALSADGERVYAVDAESDAMLRIDAASGAVAEQLGGSYHASQMLRIGTE